MSETVDNPKLYEAIISLIFATFMPLDYFKFLWIESYTFLLASSTFCPNFCIYEAIIIAQTNSKMCCI